MGQAPKDLTFTRAPPGAADHPMLPMSKSKLHPLLRGAIYSLPAVLAIAPSALSQEPISYEGGGYVRSLGPANNGVCIELFDPDNDGVYELSQLDLTAQSSVMTIRESFFENEWSFTIPDISSCAKIGGTADRLFGVQNGALVEIVRSPPLGWTTSPVGLSGFPAIDQIIGSDRPGDTSLLAIHTSRTGVTLLDFAPGGLLIQNITNPLLVGTIHDAALLNYDTTVGDELAYIDDDGLRVIDLAGNSVFDKAAVATRAFLEVLPAAHSIWNRDLLLYHHLAPQTTIGIVLARNSASNQEIYVDPLFLSSIAVADFTDNPGHELMLASGNARFAVIVSQFAAAGEAGPFLGIKYEDTNLVDFTKHEPSANVRAPAMAVADVDGDGDDDVLFADDMGRGLMVTSEVFDANARRAMPVNESFTGAGTIMLVTDPKGGPALVQYTQRFNVPPGTGDVDVKVWFQANAESTDPFIAVAPTNVTYPTTGNLEKAIQLEVPAQAASAGIYYFSFRPTGGAPLTPYPSWIGVWSADPDVLEEIVRGQRDGIYQWSSVAPGESLEPGAEGTTRRPIVHPPISGPPN